MSFKEYLKETFGPDDSGFPPLYHGTSSEQLVKTGRWHDKDVYLTYDDEQASYYAHGGHLGGAGGDVKYILTVMAKDGKTLDGSEDIEKIIMAEHDEFDDLDDFMADAKMKGFHYVTFDHPSFGKDDYHKVVVSLHPNQDLQIMDVGKIWVSKNTFYKRPYQMNWCI